MALKGDRKALTATMAGKEAAEYDIHAPGGKNRQRACKPCISHRMGDRSQGLVRLARFVDLFRPFC